MLGEHADTLINHLYCIPSLFQLAAYVHACWRDTLLVTTPPPAVGADVALRSGDGRISQNFQLWTFSKWCNVPSEALSGTYSTLQDFCSSIDLDFIPNDENLAESNS